MRFCLRVFDLDRKLNVCFFFFDYFSKCLATFNVKLLILQHIS